MTDPYKTLGVSPESSDDQINAAYRKLVKQYHPDRYVGNPLSELAAEKIKEINAAYDTIMNERKNKSSSTSQSSYSGSHGSANASFDANYIRSLINSGRLAEAEQMLSKVSVRNAEWHFLTGMVFKKKGWYDMAYQHLNRATMLDPSNSEYRAARDGLGFSGFEYRNMGPNVHQVDCCSACQGLMCADCCCEMCGGNILPCIGCR